MNHPSDEAADALGTLSHELRTPLAAIIGYADAMRSRLFGPLDQAYVDCAQTIHEAALHMLALVENLTALTGAEAAEGRRPTRRLDAQAPLEAAMRLMAMRAEAAGVALAWSASPGPIMADVDELALRQIGINLIANAITATPRGGRVTLSLAREGGDLVLTVRDTGRGLIPGAPPDGMGLGLPTVRALCAAMGGAFAIRNTPDGGAMAVARLPIARPPVASAD